MIAETAANRKMMDNVYTYDKVSNILNLKNNAPIPTSNLMGSQTDYSFVYDDLYRLTSATGSNKGSNHEDMYTLKMAYNSVHSIVKKEQLHQFKSPNATNWSPRNKTTYTYNYQYGTAQPHAPIKIGNYSYTYDANGNQTGWDDNNSGQQRQILWDEENRIKAIEDNGALFSYVYDAGGERVLKSNGGGAQVSVNGSPKGGNGSIGNYTVYVNPYVVIRNGGTTKHFYIESQRIATKILESKDGLLQNVTTTSTAPAGNRTVDYAKKQNLLENDLNLILAKVDGEAGNSGQTPPNGNAYGWGNGNGGNNGGGNGGGSNGGGNGNGSGGNGGNTGGTGTSSNGTNVEKFVFYYHPDHLGSSSYITDVNGEVSQHIEYFAFGETFVEEHSNTGTTPYKFNAKELDDETGLYYYGARYFDSKTSVWVSTDPLGGYNPIIEKEHYFDGEHNGGIYNSGNTSPYIYTYQNPVRFIDPNGKQVDITITNKIVGNTQIRLISSENFEDAPKTITVNLYRMTVTDKATGKISNYAVTRDGPVAVGTDNDWFSDNETYVENTAFEPKNSTAKYKGVALAYPEGSGLEAIALRNMDGSKNLETDAKRNGENAGYATGVMIHVGGEFQTSDGNTRITGSLGCFGIEGGNKKTKSFINDIISRRNKNRDKTINITVQKRDNVDWDFVVGSDGKKTTDGL